MRVGIEVTAAVKQRAGIGRYTRELLRELVCIDNDTRYQMAAMANRDQIDALERKLPPGAWREIHPIPVPERLMTAAWYRLGVPIHFERFAGPVDVVHGPDFVSPPTRARRVVTIHDVTFRTHPEFAEPSLVSYLSNAVPRAIDAADAVIAVSAAVAAQVAEIYPRSRHKLVTIPNGVRHPKRLPARKGNAQDVPTIVTVGTIEPRKNHLALLAALPVVRKRFSDVRLVIVGRPGWRAEAICSAIERAVADGGTCWVRDANDAYVEEILRSAAVTVYPSVAEGFGLPVLEAMARGIPTVVSDIPAHREVAGQAVLYANPDAPEEIADQLTWLLESEERQSELSTRGIQRATNFSWTETARRTRRVYEQVAGR